MSDLNQNPNVNLPQNNEDLETWLKVVSFCFPIVGAVLYFVNKDKAPKKAQTACYAALIGFGVGIVLQVIVTLLLPSS